MKCPGRGKKCLTCNKMNHFAKCCRMKGKEDKGVLKQLKGTRIVAMRNPFAVLRKLGRSNTIRAAGPRAV